MLEARSVHAAVLALFELGFDARQEFKWKDGLVFGARGACEPVRASLCHLPRVFAPLVGEPPKVFGVKERGLAVIAFGAIAERVQFVRAARQAYVSAGVAFVPCAHGVEIAAKLFRARTGRRLGTFALNGFGFEMPYAEFLVGDESMIGSASYGLDRQRHLPGVGRVGYAIMASCPN